MTSVSINRQSVAPIFLEPQANGNSLATATGFIVRKSDDAFLITNRHVVRGRDQTTDEVLHDWGGIPDSIRLSYHTTNDLDRWLTKDEPLHDDDGKPLWLEHPTYGGRVDAVALPLSDFGSVETFDYDPWSPARVAIAPSERLSIVGVPLGIRNGGVLAIWVQGFVATEIEIDHDELPRFLIDSRTRKGQSGSPVIFYSGSGPYTTNQGSMIMNGVPVCELVGVYSGRISEETDLGIVWKVRAIQEILSEGDASTHEDIVAPRAPDG
jgi:hypothetical protein